MHADPTLPRPRGDPSYFFEVETLSGLPAHRRFNLHRAYGERDTSSLRFLRRLLGFVHRERGLTRGKRNQIQSAQRLCAIAAILVEVALCLNQYATLVLRKKTNGQMIRERSCWKPYRHLLPEDAGHLRFEFLDNAGS